MPATVPVFDHCQNVQPWPCQSLAGNGEGSGPHRASQSGYPWSANHVVLPSSVSNMYTLP